MNDVCSIELLTNAVLNRLTADEEAALYDHLERCESCCARMDQLAGGEQWQREAATLLLKDDLDAAVPEASVWSEVDFSVEHLEPSNDANVLGQLGGYDVLAIIGRGGMGVVLKAFDRELKRLVAIKALSPHLAHSSVARKRFAREAQAAAAVVNPHVIAIHHVQPTGRLPFLIMPLLAGETLAQRLKSRAPLELTEVLRIGMQIAVGLAAAHDQGLVHRDVKPANIFLEKGVERVVITDFGLARAADDVSMTRLGVVAGTPEYMSPEQARGEALDARSDLFSLGCVLYEMATGVSPFRSDSTIATLRRIVDEKPAAMASIAPELPPWFVHIVERLLSKTPAQRFASASEVSQLLEACLSHLQQPTSVPLPASLVSHAKERRSIFNSNNKGVLVMLGTLGMAFLGMVIWQGTEAPDISGQWSSDEWGTVVLRSKENGMYQGTFTGPEGKQSRVVRETQSDNQIVFAPYDGEVNEVRVENGQAVKKGEVLLVLRRDSPLHQDQVELYIPSKIDGVVVILHGKQNLLNRRVRRGDRLLEIRPIASGAPSQGEFQHLSGFASNGVDTTSGSLHLKWSRLERRFNGTWGKGDDRDGKISVRLVDNEIRGAWTTNKGAQKESGSPRLADLTWKRSSQAIIDDTAPELVETPQPPQQATASDPDTNRSRDLNEFLIAWDFNYPMLGKRMAKLRVSRDMNLESVFPGRQSVKGKAPKEDVKELVELIAAQVDWVGDVGAEYERTVSSMAEFERDDTGVRTERVAINLKGRVGELQLNKSEHIEIVNRLWRLEGIVAIGGKEGLTELLAVVGQKLSNQFPEVRYKLSSGDFRFGFKDEMGTRIAYFRIPPDRNRPEMNFTLTVPPIGEPKFKLDENSNDERTKNEDSPRQPNGGARSTDSSKIYTVEEVIANGMELSSKQLPITVRVKVVSVRQEGTVNADGTKAQHWCLSSKAYNGGLDPSVLKIRVSENVEKALERNGVTDIPAHFTGKVLTITGKLSNSGLRLPGRDTIWLYDMRLDSLDQLILPVAETEDSNDEPTKNEDPPPQPHGDANSPDSPKIYTAEELIADGIKRINKQQPVIEQQPVTVRVKVVSVRRGGTVNVDGTEVQHWWLSSKEYNGGIDPSALKIRVSENVEKALERNGVTDIPAHFTGKELTITGKLSIGGVDLPGRDTIWLFDISLDSLEQLILPIAETEDSKDEPTKNEDPPNADKTQHATRQQNGNLPKPSNDKPDARAQWSAIDSGMRIRLIVQKEIRVNGERVAVEPVGPAVFEYGQALHLMIQLENADTKPLQFGDLIPTCKIQILGDDGEWSEVSLHAISVAPWESSREFLKPHFSYGWFIQFEHLRFVEPPVDDFIELRVGVARKPSGTEKNPHWVYSPPVIIELKDKPLTAGTNRLSETPAVVSDTWDTRSQEMDVVFREFNAGKDNHRAMHIDGAGKVTLINCGKPGRTSTHLSQERLDKLASQLKACQFWRVAKESEQPKLDATYYQFQVAYGAHNFFGQFDSTASWEGIEHYKKLQAILSGVIDEAVVHAKDDKVLPW